MSDCLSSIKNWSDSTTISAHLCRICFSLTDLLIPVFEGEGVEQKLFEKIQKHLPVKILPSDPFPHKLCYPCAKTLVSWDSLYDICKKTDKIFLSLLKENQSEALEESQIEKDSCKINPQASTRLRTDLLEENMSEGAEVKNEMSSEMVGCTEEDNFTLLKTETDLDEAQSNGKKSKNKDTFKCDICGKSYRSKKCLSRHIKKFHAGDKTKPEKCDLCSNKYKTKANLERHYLKEHLTDQVECPVCHVSFHSKKLDSHLKSVHGVKTDNDGEEKYKCKMCDKWFKNKYVRNSHVKEVHLSEPMKCKLCDFEGVRAVLRRHKRDVHAEKKFTCSLCPGAFKTHHTLKLHMTSHSDIRSYTCDICGMGFKRLNNVRDHMKCHQEKSNQCQICGNFFARKRYLAIHEKTIHNFYADGVEPEEKGFECGICGAKLKWKKNLLAHMRIHTGEKPYVCKICNKDFVCHGSLRTHLAKHSVCTVTQVEAPTHIAFAILGTVNSEQPGIILQ